MKKIIIIHENGNITGGSAKVAIQTAIGLSNAGYDVTYFCGTAPIDNELSAKVKRIVCLNQFELAYSPSKVKAFFNGLWNIRAYNELDKLIKSMGSDVIVHIHGWSHLLSSSIFKACKKNGIIPFVTLHDYFSVCPNGGFYNFRNNIICKRVPLSTQCMRCNCDSRSYIYKMYRILRQFVQNRFVKDNPNLNFIYISDFSLLKMKKYLSGINYFYIHNPVDSYENLCVNAIENDKYLYIGRVTPEKGADVFCKALTDLGKKGYVIGDGPQKQYLEREYPDIVFTGWKNKNEVVKYIKKAKCLIFPSRWYEGAPLVIEECLSVGIPCIVSDQCAAIDQIIDGVNGFIFETNNVEDLKKKIIQAEKDTSIYDVDKWNFSPVNMEKYIRSTLKAYGID